MFDFATLAGEMSRDHFKQSFREKGFAGTGKKWPPRRSKWARRPGNRHPMMVDTCTLLHSIKGVKDAKMKMGYGQLIKARGGKMSIGYNVSTNEHTRSQKFKRGLNPKSDGTYAAVHNLPEPGKEQRQFMGHNKALDNKIAALIPDIFQNIPKVL